LWPARRRFRARAKFGEQRPCRSARCTLALLPIPDGLDRYAEPGREFPLGQLGTAAQVTHFEGVARRRLREDIRRQRELLPVPQFDNASVGLQPQALHRGYPYPVRRIIAEAR